MEDILRKLVVLSSSKGIFALSEAFLENCVSVNRSVKYNVDEASIVWEQADIYCNFSRCIMQDPILFTPLKKTKSSTN